jgi:uncharacterized membrane protein
MIKALNAKLRYARYTTWVCYFLFIICLISGSVLRGTPVSVPLLATLPLLLFLPGMARENYKSLAMLAFVTLMYFIPLVDGAMRPTADIFHFLTVGLISILFVAAMMFSRWKQYADAGYGDEPEQAAPASQPPTTDSKE